MLILQIGKIAFEDGKKRERCKAAPPGGACLDSGKGKEKDSERERERYLSEFESEILSVEERERENTFE